MKSRFLGAEIGVQELGSEEQSGVWSLLLGARAREREGERKREGEKERRREREKERGRGRGRKGEFWVVMALKTHLWR